MDRPLSDQKKKPKEDDRLRRFSTLAKQMSNYKRKSSVSRFSVTTPRCGAPSEEEEIEEQNFEIGDYSNPEDLRILLEIFPYCQALDLIIALVEQAEVAQTLLGFSMPSKLLIGFCLAIEDRNMTAVSEAIAITSVLFRMEWPQHARFVNDAYPRIVEVLGWGIVELEIWHDCLDLICYALTALDLHDPNIMQYAIETQIALCNDETYLRYQDRVQAVQFFAIILVSQELLTDDQMENIEDLMENFLRESS
jgi:hypothetical protein